MFLSSVLVLSCLAFQVAAKPELRTFSSRSGQKSIEVEGNGDGTSWLVQRGPGGQEWTRTIPHSVVDAYLCENGTVVAHGVTPTTAAWTEEAFALTILDAEKVRLLELHPYLGRISHSGPYPDVSRLLVWESRDRCAFWVHDLGKPDQLWTYALSDGARKNVIEPEPILADTLRDDWRHCRMQKAIVPGESDLLLATFWRNGPIRGTPGPGNYVGPDLHGIAALFLSDGRIVWRETLPDGRFLRDIRNVVGTPEEMSCEVEVATFEDVGRRRVFTLVDTLALRFRRDGDGWRKE